MRKIKTDLLQLSFSQVDEVNGELVVTELHGHVYTGTYKSWYGVGDKLPLTLPKLTEIDENKFPKSVDAVIKVESKEFRGMPSGEEGKVSIIVRGSTLQLVCFTNDGWVHRKTIIAEVVKGEKEHVKLRCVLSRFKRLVAICDSFQLGFVGNGVVIVGGKGENYYANLAFGALPLFEEDEQLDKYS